jgi:hypothetical protein
MRSCLPAKNSPPIRQVTLKERKFRALKTREALPFLKTGAKT